MSKNAEDGFFTTQEDNTNNQSQQNQPLQDQTQNQNNNQNNFSSMLDQIDEAEKFNEQFNQSFNQNNNANQNSFFQALDEADIPEKSSQQSDQELNNKKQNKEEFDRQFDQIFNTENEAKKSNENIFDSFKDSPWEVPNNTQSNKLSQGMEWVGEQFEKDQEERKKNVNTQSQNIEQDKDQINVDKSEKENDKEGPSVKSAIMDINKQRAKDIYSGRKIGGEKTNEDDLVEKSFEKAQEGKIKDYSRLNLIRVTRSEQVHNVTEKMQDFDDDKFKKFADGLKLNKTSYQKTKDGNISISDVNIDGAKVAELKKEPKTVELNGKKINIYHKTLEPTENQKGHEVTARLFLYNEKGEQSDLSMIIGIDKDGKKFISAQQDIIPGKEDDLVQIKRDGKSYFMPITNKEYTEMHREMLDLDKKQQLKQEQEINKSNEIDKDGLVIDARPEQKHIKEQLLEEKLQNEVKLAQEKGKEMQSNARNSDVSLDGQDSLKNPKNQEKSNLLKSFSLESLQDSIMESSVSSTKANIKPPVSQDKIKENQEMSKSNQK